MQISRNDYGFGGGSEAANAVGPGAVAAAFYDTTGIDTRRIPLTPAYVTALRNESRALEISDTGKNGARLKTSAAFIPSRE